MTIARFVARKAGLAGNNDIEMARADQIADSIVDLLASEKCINCSLKSLVSCSSNTTGWHGLIKAAVEVVIT